MLPSYGIFSSPVGGPIGLLLFYYRTGGKLTEPRARFLLDQPVNLPQPAFPSEWRCKFLCRKRKRMTDLIISVSGLRGIIGDSLTPDVAMRYAAAYASSIPEGPIVLARDGRTSGRMLQQTIAGTLVASGRTVLDADVAATPTVGVLVRHHRAAGAIQISASHNPPEYNGIKLFSSAGRVVDAKTGAAVETAFRMGSADWAVVDRLGDVERLEDPHAPHLDLVLATVDVERIASCRFRVLLDSNRGAGSLLGRRLLDRLGCETTLLGAAPDGRFEHPPEPIADNLQGTAAAVRDRGCAVGFCQDPDADRLAIIDATGNYLGEEYTVALCVMHALEQKPGPVVINLATSSMTEEIAARHGSAVFRSAVGEANVADMMIAKDAVYGGEGNGGPIDPRVGYVRDSFVGMAQVLDLMALQGEGVGQLARRFPARAIQKDKTTINRQRLPLILESLPESFPDASVDRTDGVRLAWQDSWLLVRASNTEPIVRLIAEAPSADASVQLCRDAARAIERLSQDS